MTDSVLSFRPWFTRSTVKTDMKIIESVNAKLRADATILTPPLVVALNSTLKETFPYREPQYSPKQRLQYVIGNVVKPLRLPPPDPNPYDMPYGAYADPVNYSHIPEGVSAHTSFMYALSNAYNHHQNFSFGPHDLWYVMMTEIARAVNASPDEFAHLFTRTPGVKQTIIVDGFENLNLSAVFDQLRKLVPVDVDVFVPAFSTHTFESRMATTAAFADAVKSYYNYMTLACGIRNLEICGSENDWKLFKSHLGELNNMFAPIGSQFRDWFGLIGARVDNILESLCGGSTEFYHTIFRATKVGSGSDEKVDGWFPREFFFGEEKEWKHGRMIQNFPNTFSIVPFENINTGRKFSMVHGCFWTERRDDEFNVPQYGYMTFEMGK